MQTVLLVIGLGFAGINPLGLTLLVAALAAGAKKPHVAAFCLGTLTGTVALGVVVSVFGKELTDRVSSFIPDFDDPSWAVVELIVAALIFYWVFSHLTAPSEDEPSDAPKSPPRSSVLGMALSGLAFGGATTLDPTFFASAAIASQAPSLISMAGLHALWVLISQSPLFVFAAAYLLDAHQPLTDFVRPIWQKIERPLTRLLTVGLVIVAVGLTADAITLFATGEYLVPV